MDSVYSGYPIGMILVWRTQSHRLETYDHLGPLRLPPDVETDTARQYLLDGHQRMATLFGALGPGLFTREDHTDAMSLAEIRDEAERWPIYFDLEAEERPFRLALRRTPPPPSWLPLDRLFDPYALRDFEDSLRYSGYDRKITNRIQSVAEIFRDYVIPVVPIATENLWQVTESLSRTNGGGTRLSEVHMINALTFNSHFDLIKEFEELAADLKPVGWERIDPQMILNICKVGLGLSPGDDNVETIAHRIRSRPDILSRVRSDIVCAARVLDEVAGVRGPASLPYTTQAVLLADALHGIDQPSKDVVSRLRKWFWATTLTEYFRGMTRSLFERARQHLHEVVVGKVDPSPPDLVLVVDPIGRFDFRTARSRAISLLLAELKPIDPGVNADSDSFETLAQYGVDALSKLFLEREVSGANSKRTQGPENHFLIHPRHAEHLQALRIGPGQTLDVRAFASHAIDEAAIEALVQRQWGKFLRLRREAIENLERIRSEECGLEYRTGL
jgi:hypothetical protein